MPPDDTRPLSHSASSWLFYAATLHDALDTLYLANLTVEYDQAVSFLLKADLQTTSYHPTKTFEYSLRILGGLLGAHSVSADPRLLQQAQRAALALLEGPFRSSPTPLPRMFDILAPPTSSFANTKLSVLLHQLYAKLYRWGRDAFTQEHHFQSLAGVGSFIELPYLTALTGDERYRQAADAIFQHVRYYTSSNYNNQVMIPTAWNVMTGAPVNRGGRLGSGADSFYEYLIKQPVLHGCTDGGEQHSGSCRKTDQDMLAFYKTVVSKAIRPRHVLSTSTNVSYPVDNGNEFHHLLCFVPGMLALGAVELGQTNDLDLAEELVEGCHQAYQDSVTGFAPEQARVTAGGRLLPGQHSQYLLRPEYVESLFVLYRLTHNPRYQQLGWKVFQSLEAHCQVPNGYAGIRNVHHDNITAASMVDDTPSYFLAETLKYLLLLFGPDDYLSLDDFVLTTEAHPLRRVRATKPLCVVDVGLLIERGVPVSFPWKLAACVLVIGISMPGIVWMSIVLSQCLCGMVNKRDNHKKRS